MKVYKIADVAFSLKTVYSYTQEMLADYLYDGESNFLIKTTVSDIKKEKENAPDFPDNYLESLAVYRKLCEKLLSNYDAFLFHGSALAVDGKAYIFTAPSGTGKSTHAKLWGELLGDKVVIVNDDKPIIRFIDGDFYVYGTPWNGKHKLSTNIRAKVKAVCKLFQNKDNIISKENDKDFLSTLLSQTLRPNNSADMLKLLSLFEKFTQKVSFYKLGCNISLDAAKLSYESMSGENI